MVSGTSRHADRIATIRNTRARYGIVVDTHTADGLHVAQQYREPGVPMVCLETAQPVKFAAAIREALGAEPPRPEAVAGLEERAQLFTRMPADLRLLKRFVAERCVARADA
jgi:threonine synthase